MYIYTHVHTICVWVCVWIIYMCIYIGQFLPRHDSDIFVFFPVYKYVNMWMLMVFLSNDMTQWTEKVKPW